MSKSWSSLRKTLEQDLLCSCLRGRVQYFFTIYHGAPDEAGRFAVRVDGEEVWRAHAFQEGAYDRIAAEMKKEHEIPHRIWDGHHMLHDEENRQVEELAVKIANDMGTASSWDALGAVQEFLNLSIEKALHSENAIIRMLAILDRRVGKRTLRNLKEEYGNGPQWLKQFYDLRLEAEQITLL